MTVHGTARSGRWWLDTALARMAFGRSSGDPSLAGADAGLDALQFDLDDPAQREFGDYELLEAIGRGGMGVVYRAHQRNLEREVAIKLLSAGAWAPDELAASLRSEARNAARLHHPNIVVVHEMGEHAGLLFYAMQLVRGESLSQRLERTRRLPPREAAKLLQCVAEAVHYAHRLGVLHLDIKPGNILLGEDDEPLITDFGLARRLERALAIANERICGTPSYMAPEQGRVQGGELSPATDVYGLGAVLYETLTGLPPFLADDPHTTLRAVLEAPLVPPREHDPAIPRDLEAIVLHCLQREPHLRYASAGALADDLGHFLAGRPVQVRPLGALHRLARFARREPRLSAAIAIAGLALVVGVLATTEQWRRAEANAATASARLWESRREAALRLEQDGNGFDALPRLLQNIAEEERAGKQALAALERRRMGMMLGRGAVLIDRTAIADASPLAVEVSADGRLLALALDDRSVRWYDATTLRERGRVRLRAVAGSGGHPRMPLLLRFVDDHRLRVTLDWDRNRANPVDGETWLVDLDRAALVAPPAAFPDFADAAYSGDGRRALLRDHHGAAQLWQVSPWRPLSPLLRGPPDEALPWLLAPDGRYAARLSPGMRALDLYALPDGAAQRVSIPGNAGITAWATSHDGRWIALGDAEGRMLLLDTRHRSLRTLSTGRGREVTWLGFSEDDAWLAAARRDGAAYAFDVASGDALLSESMRHGFGLRRVGISHARRLLVAAGEGEVALWQLPLPGPRGLPAQRIGLAPARHGLAAPYAIGWSLQTGLLATAGLDGQVRLWRLPLSGMPTARAARQSAEKSWFDGRHLVAVAGNRLRIAGFGAPSSDWLALPEPPDFAELLADGRTLLVTLGPQLRVYEAPRLRLRAPPIALPAAPQRLLASDDATRLVLDFGRNGAAGYEDRLRLHVLPSGRPLAGEAVLAGPLRRLAFSTDGRRLLAVGGPGAAVTVLRNPGLQRLGQLPQDPDQPVTWAQFGDDGRRVALVAPAPDPRAGADDLRWWDYARGTVRTSATGRARASGTIAAAQGVLVAGMHDDLTSRDHDRLQRLSPPASGEPGAVLATSADGRLLARGFRRDVQLHDVASGAAIGPPLQLDSDAMDAVTQLAFAPDGRQLLARTLEGYWQRWPIAPDLRPVPVIAAGLAQLGVAYDTPSPLQAPTAAERAALRGADPGPWPAWAALALRDRGPRAGP